MKILVEKYSKYEGLVVDKVIAMCIEEDFYTKGSCEEYSNMHEMCRKYDGRIDDLKKIAMDIISHSSERVLQDFSDDYFEAVCQMMAMVEKRAGYTFYRYEQVEEEK